MGGLFRGVNSVTGRSRPDISRSYERNSAFRGGDMLCSRRPSRSALQWSALIMGRPRLYITSRIMCSKRQREPLTTPLKGAKSQRVNGRQNLRNEGGQIQRRDPGEQGNCVSGYDPKKLRLRNVCSTNPPCHRRFRLWKDRQHARDHRASENGTAVLSTSRNAPWLN